jgi:hypothetical protein
MRAKDVVRMFWLVDVDLCASRTPLFMRCVVYARVGDGLCDLSGVGLAGVFVWDFAEIWCQGKKIQRCKNYLRGFNQCPPNRAEEGHISIKKFA